MKRPIKLPVAATLIAALIGCSSPDQSNQSDEVTAESEAAIQTEETKTSETADPETADAVQNQDASLKNSPISEETFESLQSLESVSSNESCFWNDKKYSEGGVVCESGRLYKCWDGKWAMNGMC